MITMQIKPILLTTLALLTACRKFIEAPAPQTQIVSSTVYTTNGGAQSAINGIYSRIMSSSGFASGGFQSIGYLAGLSADELQNFSVDPDQTSFASNSLSSTSSTVNTYLWQEGYSILYDANAVIEGLGASTLSNTTKNQLTAEAKFIRAFCHFYLSSLFGDIPVVTSTNYQINNSLSRSSRQIVYRQILTDLQDAQNGLPDGYVSETGSATTERIRPNKWAATALLARVFLYSKDWTNAVTQASLLINNSGIYTLCTDPNQVFLANSTEAIWQLKPVIPGLNTNDAQIYTLTGTPNSAALSPQLQNSFEIGDLRRTDWIDSISDGINYYFYPFKYKVTTETVVTEYQMVFRLAEQYLIRAEGEAQLNDLAGASRDLNVIRNRAGLSNTTASSKAELLSDIMHERQIELFAEWGHRWFDLIRTGNSDAVLGPLKAPNWQQTDTLFPIPRTEISNNSKLFQNPGY